jgi:hypothetical protein
MAALRCTLAGDARGAARHWRQGEEVARALGARLELARLLRDRLTLAEPQDAEVAARHRAEAAAIFDEAGARAERATL